MSAIEYALPPGATTGHLWQLRVAGEIRVQTVDWVAPLPEGLVADYSTPDGDVYVSQVLVPLGCDRCPSTTNHIAQGRWGDELTLICIRCGAAWNPRWSGGDVEASRTLLKQIIVESGFTPGTGVGDTVEEIRDELQADLWTPSRADQQLANDLVLGVHGDPGPEAIAQCMKSTLDWQLRSLRFSEALARTVGMLRAPGGEADPEAQNLLDFVMDLARTIAAMAPDRLRHEPEAGPGTH
ncbi:hypothetical protein ACIG0C_33450 [Kitasatospora aureofaciens]|uniref:Uncharacterized protein n=1 Tax=Kitasatospora aureofaciens TaxID=1894 RepID=A0A1E7NEP0_KITAU|nr:hypothetical protein [Kitasatospora aureofaciens]ARF83337.1 hypothetical protein B6264_30940 [Kitasatospora aureofaciens]OEV39108.1 hypothetical protein HS99_0018665 [Kitasatospora aureofaciens]GGV04340.1 hypothetical protein GCM10010502_68800 [Kitasatospora aureofaciens]